MTTELSPETVVELHKIASELENAPRELREDIAREHLPFLSSVMETMAALGRSGDAHDKPYCIGARVAFQPLGDALRMKTPIARHVASAARDLASQLRRHPECQTPHPPIQHFTPVDAPRMMPFTFPENTYTGTIA